MPLKSKYLSVCITNITHSVNNITQQFKRPRILIMGCGDIGQRIIKTSPKFMRFISINSKHNHNDNYLQTQSEADYKNKNINFIFNLDNIKNKQNKQRFKKLKSFIQHIVYLIPPQNCGDADSRIISMKYLLLNNTKSNIIYVSTTGVYGNHNGNFVDETTLVNPKTQRAKRRVNAELYMRKLCSIPYRNKKLSILRVPGIYAKNRLPINRIQQAVPILNKEEDVYTNHIHADDLAYIIYMGLMGKKSRSGRIINAVDDSDIKAGDWLEHVAKTYNLPLPIRMDKQTLINNIDEKRLSFLSESRRIKNDRLKKEWKIKLKYPNIFMGL